MNKEIRKFVSKSMIDEKNTSKKQNYIGERLYFYN